MILALKLLLSPLLIAASTLAGRRWGPMVSGWFLGFPFISGPVSLVLAVQSGYVFATQAAVGSLAGQVGMCIFCAAYTFLARKLPWWLTAPLSVGAYLGVVALWNQFPLPLLAVFAILIAVIFLLLWAIPKEAVPSSGMKPTWWDMPARMLTAGLFVFTITTASHWLGPMMSGVLATFPVFGTTLASFTHAQQGGRAAGQLLRGTILGSLGIAVFNLVVGLLLPLTGSLWVYLLAAAATFAVNGITLRYTLQGSARTRHRRKGIIAKKTR